MAMTPEDRRRRDRERKRRQRAENQAKPKLEALPQIGPASRGDGGTQGGTSSDVADVPTNLSAALDLIAELDVKTAAGRYRVALILQLARDLDEPSAIPQRASLSARYTENVDALLAIAKPRERDDLDELRRAFYTGSVDGIDDDPEAPTQRRTVRKKA
jgi:hypothetical protein